MGSSSKETTSTQPAIRQQEIIAEFGQKALDTDDIDQLLYDASITVAETLDLDYVTVLELLPSGDEAVLTQGIGWRDDPVGSNRKRAIASTHDPEPIRIDR